MSTENPPAAPSPPAGQKRERPQQQEIDELALEQPRVSLLDTLDGQLRDQKTVSRIVILCQVEDKRQKDLADTFAQWIEAEPEVTGVLAFLGGAIGLHLLEGPTQLLFQAAKHLNEFSQERLAKLGKPDIWLLSNMRILYLSELYTTRASLHWCSFFYTSMKANAGALGSEATDSERCFHSYKTLLVASLKVKDQIVARQKGEPVDFSQFGSEAPILYKNWGETLVSQEDLTILLSKECLSLFDYAEFEEMFMLPPKLRLESDLLWPMPPPPVY